MKRIAVTLKRGEETGQACLVLQRKLYCRSGFSSVKDKTPFAVFLSQIKFICICLLLSPPVK